MDFNKLKSQVADNFDSLSKNGNLFVLPINRDEIFDRYLDGFEDPALKQELK